MPPTATILFQKPLPEPVIQPKKIPVPVEKSHETIDHLVKCTVKVDNEAIGEIVFNLYTKTNPILTNRFLELKNAKCKRLVRDGYIQLQAKVDVPELPDENFIHKHERGSLAMVNNGPNTNTNQFMVLFKRMEYFDYKFVVIGKMVEGDETLKKIQKLDTEFEKSKQEISLEFQ